MELSGSSYLDAGIFDFVHWLEQCPDISDVALRSTQPGQNADGPMVNFNVEVNFKGPHPPVHEVAQHE